MQEKKRVMSEEEFEAYMIELEDLSFKFGFLDHAIEAVTKKIESDGFAFTEDQAEEVEHLKRYPYLGYYAKKKRARERQLQSGA